MIIYIVAQISIEPDQIDFWNVNIGLIVTSTIYLN